MPAKLPPSTAVALATALALSTISIFAPQPAGAAIPDSVRAELSTPWTAGSGWLAMRGGYAKSGEPNAPSAGFGAGIGYSRMLSKWKLYRWTLFKNFSFGGYVHVEQLGTLGRAAEYSIPVTVELNRHFRWSTYMRPYLGIGGGEYYHKLYRTGADRVGFKHGGYVVLGMNAPLDRERVLGADLRISLVDVPNDEQNPVFPHEDPSTLQWSFKVNYALVD